MRKLFLLIFLSVVVLAWAGVQAGDDQRWPTCENWQVMTAAEKRIYTIAYGEGIIAASVYADSVDRSANVAQLLYNKMAGAESAGRMEARVNTACQENPGDEVAILLGRIVFGLGR